MNFEAGGEFGVHGAGKGQPLEVFEQRPLCGNRTSPHKTGKGNLSLIVANKIQHCMGVDHGCQSSSQQRKADQIQTHFSQVLSHSCSFLKLALFLLLIVLQSVLTSVANVSSWEWMEIVTPHALHPKRTQGHRESLSWLRFTFSHPLKLHLLQHGPTSCFSLECQGL